MRFRIAGILLLLALFTAVSRAAELTPSDLSAFFLLPDRPATLRWTGAAEQSYIVRDYYGRQIATGRTTVENGTTSVTLTLPDGYYEVEFPDSAQTFGIIARPPYGGTIDPFWGIDSALSWLELRPEVRDPLIANLRRSGIGISRERLSWGQIRPSRDTWDWESSRRYDDLRRTYARHGVTILEMFHDSPAAIREEKGRYPTDMAATHADWREITRRFQPTWGALEIWNEPELEGFGSNRPPDRLLPVIKTVAHAARAEGVRVPVGGGVFTEGVSDDYRDQAVRNGLLDHVDFVSFHIYAPSPAFEPKTREFREWLTKNGHESMPLWITESGLPWTRGPGRPPVGEDSRSALEVTMKAIEARACGIQRFFPFVYPFYNEKDKNFGMMGKDATPLRSMAGYVQAVRALSGLRYVGDLRTEEANVKRARVFGSGPERVLVLYTGVVSADASVKLDLPVKRVEGIDGRQLAAAGNAIPVPDGMAYVWLDTKSLGSRLVTNTGAAALSRAAAQPRPARPVTAPVVLQFQSPSYAGVSNAGYAIASDRKEPMAFTVRVTNLSGTPQEVMLEAKWDGKGASRVGPARQVTVPAGEARDVAWDVDLSDKWEKAESVGVTVNGTAGKARISPLAVAFRTERDLPQYLRLYPDHTRLAIDDPARWQSNIMPTGKMRISKTAEGAWRMDAEFGTGDPWVYPLLPLTAAENLKGADALLVRGRALTPGTVRFMVWEKEGAHYLTPSTLFPADGKWYVRLIPFRDFSRFSASATDANGKLDIENIARLSIGMNAGGNKAELEISDVYVVRGLR